MDVVVGVTSLPDVVVDGPLDVSGQQHPCGGLRLGRMPTGT